MTIDEDFFLVEFPDNMKQHCKGITSTLQFMKNIDVEIYISQMITFFEKNPKDFIDLVGNIEKEIFYNKMKERSLKNVKEEKDLILTKEQIIDIVIELQDPNLNEKKDDIKNIENIILKTKFGNIFLN